MRDGGMSFMEEGGVPTKSSRASSIYSKPDSVISCGSVSWMILCALWIILIAVVKVLHKCFDDDLKFHAICDGTDDQCVIAVILSVMMMLNTCVKSSIFQLVIIFIAALWSLAMCVGLSAMEVYDHHRSFGTFNLEIKRLAHVLIPDVYNVLFVIIGGVFTISTVSHFYLLLREQKDIDDYFM